MAEAESSKTAFEEKIAHLETEIVMKRELVASMEAHPESDPDVVVVDDDAQPLVLCECKAPEIPIDRHVLAQAVRYNSVLGARYLVLTNGRSHYCYELVEGEYRQCDRFPSIGSGMGD